MRLRAHLRAHLTARLTGAAMIASLIPSSAAMAAFVPPDPAARISLVGDRWRVVSTACAALPADAGLRQRLVDVAAQEWARFGYPVEEIRETGLTTVFSPPRGVIISPGLNRVRKAISRRGMRLGATEDDRAVQAAIGGYWTAAPDGAGIAIQNQLRADYRSTGWAVPWSAAFISYLACASGAGRMEQFARSDSHSTYVDQAIGAADGQTPRAIYRARDIVTGLPRAGDLICADRSWPTRFRTIADRRPAVGEESALHCDLVVRVDRRGGFVAAIGGNVADAVTMTLVNIVRPGKGPARLQTAADVEGAKAFFAVLELATGGTASLDRAPAVRRMGQKR